MSELNQEEIQDVEQLTDETALSVPKSNAVLADSMLAGELRERLKQESETRLVVREFVEHHLIEGVDYGYIHIVKDCADKINCKNKYHWTQKPTLFKPGSDKFMSLFHFFADYKIDHEILSLYGDKPGLIPLRCFIYNAQGGLIAEGSGACDTVGESKTQNTAIKIARKRAKMDAIYNSGLISDFFSIQHEKTLVSTQNRPQQSQTITASNKCTECGATGQYHSPKCTLNPANQNTVDPRPVPEQHEEVEDLDDLPF